MRSPARGDGARGRRSAALHAGDGGAEVTVSQDGEVGMWRRREGSPRAPTA